MKLWKRVFCVLPLILLLIQVAFKTVPLTPCVVQDGNQVKIYWTNFIYEYNLDVIVNYTMLFCLAMLVVVGFTEKEVEGVEDQKQKLLVRLLRLTKPRAGSIYSVQQEEGMMLLLTELLVGVKPRSRDHVEGLLHNLKYGFTAKGPKSKTIKKLMELMENRSGNTKKETTQ